MLLSFVLKINLKTAIGIYVEMAQENMAKVGKITQSKEIQR